MWSGRWQWDPPQAGSRRSRWAWRSCGSATILVKGNNDLVVTFVFSKPMSKNSESVCSRKQEVSLIPRFKASGSPLTECHNTQLPPSFPLSLDSGCVLNTYQHDQLDCKDFLKMCFLFFLFSNFLICIYPWDTSAILPHWYIALCSQACSASSTEAWCPPSSLPSASSPAFWVSTARHSTRCSMCAHH